MGWSLVIVTTDAYHHGHLRSALLGSAMEVLRERGVEGLTLREVARRAGVSHNAPYHHFADKGALVEALAIEGFERFAEAFRRAVAASPDRSHLGRIRAIGEAYVRFALREPALFTLMWRPDLRTIGEPSPVDDAGLASYRMLLEEIEAGQAAGEVTDGDVGLLGLAAWSTVHGLAMLVIEGPLREQATSWRLVRPLADAVLDGAMRALSR
jgi:AcrR family transcriptional regulator